MLSPPPIPSSALVIAAHPDDAEFGAGGTVAAWTAAGADVRFLILSSGDKGTHDPAVNPFALAALREDEQRAAAEALGAREVRFLRLLDGEIEANLALRARVCLIVRQMRPQVVVTHDPWRLYQLHPDHRACGLVASDAA